MLRRITVVLLGLVAACDSVDSSMSNINNKNKPDAATNDGSTANDVAAAKDAPAGSEAGACTTEYIPLSELTSPYFGDWVIDDATTNTACPNAYVISVGPGGGPAAPADPDERPCGSPGVFFIVKPHDLKDCSHRAYCAGDKGAWGFFIHSVPVGTKIVDVGWTMWIYSNGMWEHNNNFRIIASPDNGGTLNYNDVHYHRTNVVGGTCMEYP